MLELTAVQFGWNFRIVPSLIFLQVIWTLGWSRVVLAALVHWPLRTVAAFGIGMIAGHNLLDGITADSFGAGAGPGFSFTSSG